MAPGDEEDREGQAESRPERRPFNPMVTYFYTAMAIFASYCVFYLLGWAALVIVMCFFLVSALRETSFILRNVTSGLARKAAYVNASIALVFFSILLLNAYWITHFEAPLILPEIDQLTLICPLFVLTSVFGSKNIRLMYDPA